MKTRAIHLVRNGAADQAFEERELELANTKTNRIRVSKAKNESLLMATSLNYNPGGKFCSQMLYDLGIRSEEDFIKPPPVCPRQTALYPPMATEHHTTPDSALLDHLPLRLFESNWGQTRLLIL